MKNAKKIAAVALASTMAVGMMAGCGSSDSKGGSSKGNDAEGIRVYNSKVEIQTQLEGMAKTYTEKTGVPVEIVVQASDGTVTTDLSTAYASNDPYSIAMVDAKDIYSLCKEHAVDLSDQDWVKNTDYAISVDDKVYGFPFCVEARGLIYNADAIKKVTGKDFDPSQYQTLDAFKGLLDELKKGGMETPTGIMKEDWSLGAHYLAEVYEQQADTDAFLKNLHDGKEKIGDNDKFNSMIDTFDVLMENNYAKDSAISAEREVTEQKLAEGEIAFMFGGNWDWSVLNQYSPSENMGMMPVPQNTDDGTNTKLVGGGSKYFFVDNSISEKQQKEAKDFLNWLVSDEEGQKGLVTDCALVPAFKNITVEVADPLGKSVKSFADQGLLIPNYNYLPDDHFTVLGGEAFQKYLGGKSDRKTFANDIDTYWQKATLTEH
ncbi:carbohydrate ABC transporter substrate-binding protein, CUT1 family [Lachnospiraceae bacterium C10]|jgi:raffinose/stachyose/melibiose transport system substrate-binding protein|nr:carbohydrate ABC transporter substrate-binding protein, CUT1 family [Lachnospiraceae bacterium C10]SDW57994.1 carbohydrate ABC transporter substrate-binding protein, CUT1 family [Lachnospiraceae bacterium KHCPX20]